ncbi:MAG: hypothetical protein AVDCRST_MAG05-1869, partial [uncultured Rubrobacteraceae bacterium]
EGGAPDRSLHLRRHRALAGRLRRWDDARPLRLPRPRMERGDHLAQAGAGPGQPPGAREQLVPAARDGWCGSGRAPGRAARKGLRARGTLPVRRRIRGRNDDRGLADHRQRRRDRRPPERRHLGL